MLYDLNRVRANVARAETDDLLDRVTVYRDGMEEDALEVIEAELARRGISAAAIVDHRQKREAEGAMATRCHRCRRPAVAFHWGWHRLWGLVPLFPRRFAWCPEHLPHPPQG